MTKRWLVGAFIVMIGMILALADGVVWAAPWQSPLHQTVPPTPRPRPTGGGGGGDSGSGGGSGQPGVPVPPPPVPMPGQTVTPTLILTPVSTTGVLTPTHFPNCRLGAAVANNPIGTYAHRDLNLGWYVNYSASRGPAAPPQLEFVGMIRVHQKKYGRCDDCYSVPYGYTMSPDAKTLEQQVAANPGSTWLIGNEPDRRDWQDFGQDEIVPELYAQAYHEIRQIIRTADPTAKTAIGGLMQATPLRLVYLDRVWEQYQALYGRRLGDDVDLWNVHGFILREEKGNWGANIPPGLNDSQGMLYEVDDNDSLRYFTEQLIRFRTWMRDKGERYKPLYISEYGINMPADYISADRVKAFMTGTFDFMLNATDAELGYPVDHNRLVQRFLWYSLDDSKDSPSRAEDYSDALFSSVTHKRLDYGDNWAAYVVDPAHPEASQPRINLLTDQLEADFPSSPDAQASTPITVTLRAVVHNNGNTRTRSGDGIQVHFWEGRPGDPKATLIGTRVISDIYGCGYGVMVTQPWAMSPATARPQPWYVAVETLKGEGNTTDNLASSEGR